MKDVVRISRTVPEEATNHQLKIIGRKRSAAHFDGNSRVPEDILDGDWNCFLYNNNWIPLERAHHALKSFTSSIHPHRSLICNESLSKT